MTTTRPTPTRLPAIVRTEDTCSGNPRVEGTRVPVHAIVALYQAQRGDVAYIYGALPTLPPGGVEAALAYYGSHREEIDAILDESIAAASE